MLFDVLKVEAGTGDVIAIPGAILSTLVSEKFTVARPDADAVTVKGPPARLLALNGAEAIPDAFVDTAIVVVLLMKAPEGPLPGAVKVTLIPGNGLLPASLTVTAGAIAKAALIAAFCGVVPAFADIDAGAPTVLVSEKLTVARPVEDAVTAYGPPTVLFAVKGTEAVPDASVAAVMAVVLLPKPPDAPLPGAVKVTLTPDTGLFPASLIVTERAFAKDVLIAALCGVVPAVADTEAAAPTVLFNKILTAARPVEAAVTV